MATITTPGRKLPFTKPSAATMRANVFAGPNRIEIREVPIP